MKKKVAHHKLTLVCNEEKKTAFYLCVDEGTGIVTVGGSDDKRRRVKGLIFLQFDWSIN